MTGRDQVQDRPIEDLEAADAFRATLLNRADGYRGPAPLWHGWAIFDAFLAGMDHARQQPTAQHE
jgi:hypothetical protein